LIDNYNLHTVHIKQFRLQEQILLYITLKYSGYKP